jgi:hypothetical protein
MQTPLPLISQNSLDLASTLRTLQPGEVIPYFRLSQTIGRNVQREGYGCLTTARRLLQRENRILFSPVKGVGLKRLTDSEITSIGPQTLLRINRSSRQGAQKLTCIKKFASLTNEEKIRHNTALSILGVFFEISQSKSVNRIGQTVAVLQKQLPLREALTALLASNI